MPLNEHVYCVAVTLKMTEWAEQWICIEFCIKLEHLHGNYSDDSGGHSYGQLVIGNFITTTHLLTHHILCRVFGETSNPPGDSATCSPDLVPCDIWLFPKLNYLQKGRDFRPLMRFRKIRQDSWWRLGENCVRSQGAYFEGDWDVIVLYTMFLVSCIFFNKYLYFSYYMAG